MVKLQRLWLGATPPHPSPGRYFGTFQDPPDFCHRPRRNKEPKNFAHIFQNLVPAPNLTSHNRPADQSTTDDDRGEHNHHTQLPISSKDINLLQQTPTKWVSPEILGTSARTLVPSERKSSPTLEYCSFSTNFYVVYSYYRMSLLPTMK